ncbi:MAG: immunity protein Imm33 domain-containing protein [Armatimonadota bacterium]
MPSWTLENVEATHRAHPDSFFIASRQERTGLKVGALVRLHFVLAEEDDDLPRAERMWVEITRRGWLGRSYTGVLTNEPAYIEDLHVGDTITFRPEHIAQILVRKDDPNWSAVFELGAIVSKKVLAPCGFAGFIYREEPHRKEDSGWRILAGDESDDDIDDPDNSTICNVGWLADRDPSMEKLLRQAQPGTAFERSGPKGKWQPVTDWQPEA